ncbi:MAG: class I SAM-dependent methyltransferase [Sphingomonas sp.]|nr:class I SAM-dependent methyltransferase [Sphingomonas sp.]
MKSIFTKPSVPVALTSASVAIGPPTLAKPVSQACTANQFLEDAYAYWCEQLFEGQRMHRKQWEFCYIAQALSLAGALSPGRCGVGFGVGAEPLGALFAARGAKIVGTDLEPEQAKSDGWIDTDQHASGKHAMNDRGICPADRFERNVSFRFADMNDIPAEIGHFDFCWSACAFEHLGSISNGHDFILNTARLLKPGGTSVHTTELNCSSNDETLSSGSTVLFRRRDFEAMAADLTKMGFEVAFNWDLGDQPLDYHVDMPPYSEDKHLKLQLDRWVSTSFGLIIRKPL